METLIINGGGALRGSVEINGAKNAAIAILPATLLIDGVCTINNLPNISDVQICCTILEKLGAKISVEGKTAIIKGVKKLYGAKVMATDLRGGASLVLAGLVAKGTTNVENIEYILRGYENLDGKLKNLGAEIYMIKS